MELKFRNLNADEIDCRVAAIKKDGSGLSLLLYKDARVDQNILDETVGPMNWQRRHTRDNANCIVSLWDPDKAQWIEKEDTGTESNTEAEKGLASDSFKRACFNWGIGRELYTAPFIWITADKCTITKDLKCYDRFYVASITITDGKITQLFIGNKNTGKIVFEFGCLPAEKTVQKKEVKEPAPVLVDPQLKQEIILMAKKAGVALEVVLQQAGVKDLSEMTALAGTQMRKALQRKIVRNGNAEAQGQTA